MRESAKNIRENPHAGTQPINNATLDELEGYARELGISTIGYTRVKPDFIFRDCEILFENAIILTMACTVT